jgi:5-methylcytosine-specific restriction protein A
VFALRVRVVAAAPLPVSVVSPSVPGSRCVEPGCGELAPFGQARCAGHAADLSRDLHAGPHRRVYATSRWAAARREVLARDPTCRSCGAAPSTDVDHDVPLREVLAGGGDPYDVGNLVGLCASCHSRKTAAEVGLGG